jgi:hypothetical protein
MFGTTVNLSVSPPGALRRTPWMMDSKIRGDRRRRRDDRKAARAEEAQKPRRAGLLRGEGSARRDRHSEGHAGTSLR